MAEAPEVACSIPSSTKTRAEQCWSGQEGFEVGVGVKENSLVTIRR